LSPSRSRRYPCGGSITASTRSETESAGNAFAGAEAAWIYSAAKRSAADQVSNKTVTEAARAETVRHASASIIEKRNSIRGIIAEAGSDSMQNRQGANLPASLPLLRLLLLVRLAQERKHDLDAEEVAGVVRVDAVGHP
jgi:hypothetical protein